MAQRGASIRRRVWRAAATALAGLLVVIACVSSTVAQSIKEGGTLVVATPSDILAADPLLAPDLSTYYVANQVIQGLVGLRPGTTSEIIPVLASALPQVSADGLTYTFKLRSGIDKHQLWLL